MPEPQLTTEHFDARRKRLAEAMGDRTVLVVATHAEALHSNDVYHRFRPHSDLWYLTGFNEPQAVLVLRGGTAESHLFVAPRDPDHEIWNGRRLGVQGAKDAMDVDHAHDIAELATRLPGIVEGQEVRTITAHHPEMHERVHNAVPEHQSGSPQLAALRCIKDADEVRMLQHAADLGMQGHRAAFGALRPGQHEYHLQAAFDHAVRGTGSTGTGYPAIVGAGANAAILHYIDNQDPIKAGDMVLMDAGCEWGYYNSDITRTVPADGEWTDMQRRLYELVLDAHTAAVKKVQPGNRFRDPHDAAVKVLTTGLCEMGIIDVDLDKALEDEAYRPYFMHGVSHFLGLDVHDPGAVKDDDGKSRVLEEGMVLTIEPGIYFNPDQARLPDGIASCGIRIEDDLLVTVDGHRNLTESLPRDAEGVLGLLDSTTTP